MTKGELRKARKAARARGERLTGALAVDQHRDDSHDRSMFSETPRGRDGLERWARRYDALNGAPENDDDR